MKTKQANATALVLTLAVITIISALLISFVASAKLNRQSTANYGQSLKAQELGVSALQEIVSELKQEIDAGSLPNIPNPEDLTKKLFGEGEFRVYVPSSREASMPARRGFQPNDYGVDVDVDTLPPTLVAVSRHSLTSQYTGNYDAAKLPANTASQVSTATRSFNGREISPKTWNKPRILTGVDSPPAVFTNQPPDWIYVTRSGSKDCSSVPISDLVADRAMSNPQAVVGRYAYVIYDEGGLLDVNVAGYFDHAKTLNPADVGGKGFTAFADLTRVPGLSPQVVDRLVKWRSHGSLNTESNYVRMIQQAAPGGFLTVKNQDNPLLSRQDLINYVNAETGASTALPYLGSFSRAVTSPSWRPLKKTVGVDYISHMEETDSENRDLANARDADGTPLLKKRFPLSRISLVQADALAVESSTLHQHFGLRRDSASSSWTYDHGDPHSILTLDQVRQQNREPDFFEILKAVILNGSLGKDPGGALNPAAIRTGGGGLHNNGPAGQFFGPQGGFEGYSSIPDLQILQIGANIIDQYDTDSFPTSIYLDAVANPSNFSGALTTLFNTVHGIENLPYIYGARPLRWKDTTSDLPYGQIHGWLQPALWNPHQVDVMKPPALKPSMFRLRIQGVSEIVDVPGSGRGTYAANSYRIMDFDAPPPQFAGCNVLTFTDSLDELSPYYNRPVYLTRTMGVSSPNSKNLWEIAHGNVVGSFAAFYAGHMRSAPSLSDFNFRPYAGSTLTITAEYQDSSGVWQPYTRLARYVAENNHGFGSPVNTVNVVPPGNATNGGATAIRPDPRTDRFSCSIGWQGLGSPASETAGTNSYWAGAGSIRHTHAFHPAANRGFFYSPSPNGGSTGARSGLFAVNQRVLTYVGTTTTGYWAYYTDPDGEIRPGDAYRGGGGMVIEGRPTFNSVSSPLGGSNSIDAPRRPVVLDRPFKSVGELGYVFRDLPFKTLDFTSRDSADAGLLDVFCIEEEPEVVAGQINPNNANVPVLEAILAGAYKRKVDPSVRIDAEADAVATAIANYVQDNGPIQNRADLVVHAEDPDNASSENLSADLNSALPNVVDRANKAYAEAPVRALAPVTNTRTWNLMIDVIAQSGRITKSASSLSDFLVEGERRYWLHVAIDRYTGQVVDSQLEPVFE